MVVVRGYAHCKTCGENYILRVGIGTEKHQLHTFDCKSCQIPISVVVRENLPHAHFEAEENASIEEHKGENAIVLNLHPFFAFNSDEIHNREAFSSLSYLSKIMPYLRLVSNRNFWVYQPKI